jgi:hypothetical protein
MHLSAGTSCSPVHYFRVVIWYLSPAYYFLLISTVQLCYIRHSAAICVTNIESRYQNPIVFIHVAFTETGFCLNSYHAEISASLSMAPSLYCAIFATCQLLWKWYINSETRRKFVIQEILNYDPKYLTLLNPLNPSGHSMYRQVSHSTIVRSAHTVYLCVLCGSQNKQRLFPYTALTDWFL